MFLASSTAIYCQCPTSTAACEHNNCIDSTAGDGQTIGGLSVTWVSSSSGTVSDDGNIGPVWEEEEYKLPPPIDRSWARQDYYNTPWVKAKPYTNVYNRAKLYTNRNAPLLPRPRVMGRFFDHRPSRYVVGKRSAQRRS